MMFVEEGEDVCLEKKNATVTVSKKRVNATVIPDSQGTYVTKK